MGTDDRVRAMLHVSYGIRIWDWVTCGTEGVRESVDWIKMVFLRQVVICNFSI